MFVKPAESLFNAIGLLEKSKCFPKIADGVYCKNLNLSAKLTAVLVCMNPCFQSVGYYSSQGRYLPLLSTRAANNNSGFRKP
jgi:hypothetical protein